MRDKFFFILIICFSVFVLADDIEFKAGVNADKIGIDDVLIFTVTFKGIQNPPQPDVSVIKDFRITQTSRSTEFRFVNGVSSYYTNFEFYLEPLKTGISTIPEVSYTHQGVTYRTSPFQIEVIEGSVGPPPAQKRRKSVFGENFFSSPFDRTRNQKIDVKLDTWVSEKDVIEGQQIIVKILLYTRSRIESINIVSNQSFPGFWQEWFPVPRSIDGKTVQKDGKAYQVYEIRKVALFPRKAGILDIPSLKFELSLADQSFSFFSSPRKFFRESPPLKIKVSDISSEARGLSVGEFNFEIHSQKSELDVNDILTLKLKIKGQGNLKTIVIPEFETNDFFKAYPAKITRKYDFRKSQLSGVLTGEIPIAFKTTGIISLPSLHFKYYSPDKNRVIQVSSRPVDITVTGTRENQESVVTLPKTEIIKKGEDIDFIKKGKISNQQWKFHQQRLFVFLLVFPFLINFLFVLKKTVLDRILLRSKLLNKTILMNNTIKGLKAVKDHGEIYVIVENYLQQKSGLGFSEITNENIETFFRKYRISDYDIAAFIHIKSKSESSRFSPQKKSNEDLKHDVESMISILRRIDKRIK
ncbi:MAG: BatD family protein [Candidatus Aminicenantes bacterium]|nr:BatD family protein [Candidatus Aminicenantes bacterium]